MPVPTRLSIDAPPGVIAALLDLANGADAPCAVRQSLGEPIALTSPVIDRLASLGALSSAQAKPSALSPVFREAARVLADPRSHVRIRLWSDRAEATTSIYFSEGGTAKPGVGLTEQGDRFRLTAPIEASALLNMVDEGFLSVSQAAGQDFGALLDSDAARTLFGILDWIRAGGGEAMGGDWTGPPIRFDLEAARRHHGAGVARASGVMFAPYLLLALGADRGFDRERWNSAARKLTRSGLLTEVPGGGALGSSIRTLGETTTALTGALQWEVTMRDETDGIVRQSRIALALGPTLLLVLDRTDDGLLVHTPGADALRADVVAFAMGRRSRERRTPSAVSARSQAPPKATTPSHRSRFCRQCGGALRPSASFCSSCGVKTR